MRLKLVSEPSVKLTTFGELFLDDSRECVTLEDQVREIPGEPVSSWKVPKQTAIRSGTYELYLVDSPAHGPDTLRLHDVEGFECIDIHSGVSKESTEGCITVGDTIHPDTLPPSISGGLKNGVLAKLKAKVVPLLKAGERVFIDVIRS